MAFYACKNNPGGSGRNPQGNAVTENVLSGKTFANASSDSLTGSMANYSGSNRRTITVSAGTGNQTINLSAGYHDSVIVDRTAAYNAGADSVKNTEWGEPISVYADTYKFPMPTGDEYRYSPLYKLGISCKNATKLVKDATWSSPLFAVGLYTQMNGWENGQGSYQRYYLSDISTLTFSGSTYPGLLITGSINYTSYAGGRIKPLDHGTVYFTLWRKGIG